MFSYTSSTMCVATRPAATPDASSSLSSSSYVVEMLGRDTTESSLLTRSSFLASSSSVILSVCKSALVSPAAAPTPTTAPAAARSFCCRRLKSRWKLQNKLDYLANAELDGFASLMRQLTFDLILSRKFRYRTLSSTPRLKSITVFASQICLEFCRKYPPTPAVVTLAAA